MGIFAEEKIEGEVWVVGTDLKGGTFLAERFPGELEARAMYTYKTMNKPSEDATAVYLFTRYGDDLKQTRFVCSYVFPCKPTLYAK